MLSARDTLYREETPRASALRCVELSSRFCRSERGRELFEAGTALRRLPVRPAARWRTARLPRGKRSPRHLRGEWAAGGSESPTTARLWWKNPPKARDAARTASAPMVRRICPPNGVSPRSTLRLLEIV